VIHDQCRTYSGKQAWLDCAPGTYVILSISRPEHVFVLFGTKRSKKGKCEGHEGERRQEEKEVKAEKGNKDSEERRGSKM
jgi:hypothetical protein